jgi:hypothetical protein
MLISDLDPSFSATREQLNELVHNLRAAYLLDEPHRFAGDRRVTKRFNVTIPVEITLLDDQLQPIGYSCQAITRDVSIKGIGIVSYSPIGRQYVMLTLKPHVGEERRAVARVVYQNEIGYYHQIGCEFISTSSKLG